MKQHFYNRIRGPVVYNKRMGGRNSAEHSYIGSSKLLLKSVFAAQSVEVMHPQTNYVSR